MHEFAIMNELIETVLEECKKHSVLKVAEVVLALGELANLTQVEAQTAFNVLKLNHPQLQSAVLKIELKPAVILCRACGYRGNWHGNHNPEYNHGTAHHRRTPIILCPNCEGVAAVESGGDCVIQTVRIAMGDENEKSDI